MVVEILTSDVAVLPPGDTIKILKCEPQIKSEDLTGREILMIVQVGLFTLNFTQPIVFLLNPYIVLLYGLLYILSKSFPIAFGGIYYFNLGH
ncbi:hypothetical protein IFM47457_10707 [Aspergillus lentulus]|nr:hypothetical protein IFM47457_10707 [Aspergillus lentulus]